MQEGAPIPADAWEYQIRKSLNDAAYQNLSYKPYCSRMPVCKKGECKDPKFIFGCVSLGVAPGCMPGGAHADDGPVQEDTRKCCGAQHLYRNKKSDTIVSHLMHATGVSRVPQLAGGV